MPGTPDEFPGDDIVETLWFEDEGSGVAAEIGQVRLTDERFSMKDSIGEFDPRTGGLGLLIFTSSGGLVYDSNGDLVIKASD